ncbi:MAG: hypothetical protein ACOC56_02315 [Atribacterota bacterium]
MESEQCEICGKIIEGFTKKQADYLMKQHQITHDPDFEKPNNKQALIEIFRLIRNTGRSNMINKNEIVEILDKYHIKFEE